MGFVVFFFFYSIIFTFLQDNLKGIILKHLSEQVL